MVTQVREINSKEYGRKARYVTGIGPESPKGEWIAWARGKADQFDPLGELLVIPE
jgi:hypothetical protein